MFSGRATRANASKNIASDFATALSGPTIAHKYQTEGAQMLHMLGSHFCWRNRAACVYSRIPSRLMII